ncbi:MAG TPA: ATP synthase F0 subunit B [Candidatus Acidoferrales bacterium]|nr:ATP synthase F0 subunit B [Candidatus Acidoferrales bacterium]
MKRLAGLLRATCLAGASVLLAAHSVLAQESTPSPADSSTGWVFRWINFAIVLALIVYGFRKAAPSFRRNADDIAQRIAEGTRAREAAERQRREAQAKLAGIENEVAVLRVEAKRSAEAESERLKELARVEAETIERSAQAEIAAAERAARLELKAYAAQIALERAEQQLRRELTPQAEAVLFGTFVGELERSVN